ncbi:hypothetical protein GJW-30_1_00077 [Variibacter gotjawalensis]|uniref:DUF2188 domain-containing protein n=1 Tax=Variibacter gotjawalensis TaxID=1333996 RepID=A0A0S3PNV5_9BRAD|nr:hypothetical protein [Variibacter gotjawalensis]NIK47857.1 hypothetical protein [Variibacter gotjawalensis]RZS49743.1 hypothetical protein EV661_2183 [Variibacter gotjawalensis]BAT57571.1 hypothetical protein GJW-30_1_00077 [Variibacter gotjawalensis]
MPSDIAAIVYVTPVGNRWSVRYDGQEIIGDLILHDAKEAAERVAETLRERGFQFVRVKTERSKRGRWARSERQ